MAAPLPAALGCLVPAVDTVPVNQVEPVIQAARGCLLPAEPVEQVEPVVLDLGKPHHQVETPCSTPKHDHALWTCCDPLIARLTRAGSSEALVAPVVQVVSAAVAAG